ncbi:bis(5'-nucleosyl)-tetraphosphatase (symmetrical) YqeK [Treponema endosymbiont of Eucomonympha sp.]|jgi:nicotinate-nucleotide adenylyltransferase|uniref:bis(5'-nucleosyl)-tetraphosphatase (symmetrical) YqeK n=1 Tax=Treponema endosymbiont of Eucomonympha sp. TaxID=1580831 RepID=UPI000B0A9530|nr:bis(5'-nucleosyl)-tetraphosphatase (symmetrical) YqeK [Treponema endosymbiont of Eucomonympha sp.]
MAIPPETGNVVLEAVRCFIRANLKPVRYAHSFRVAETAVRLCAKYGIAPENAPLAGTAHDMCKDMDDETLTTLALRDGMPLTPLETQNPALLHGRAAAVKLREGFGVSASEVLEAVRLHTFGKAGMCPLAQIIYVADKIEPGRTQVTTGYLSALEPLTLPQLLRFVTGENLAFLEKQGKRVAPESQELYQWTVSR